jgi:hypothetical protein
MFDDLVDALWQMRQQGQIDRASNEARDGYATAHRAESDVIALRHEVKALRATCAAMWGLLKEKLALTDEELRTRLEATSKPAPFEDPQATPRKIPLKTPRRGPA